MPCNGTSGCWTNRKKYSGPYPCSGCNVKAEVVKNHCVCIVCWDQFWMATEQYHACRGAGCQANLARETQRRMDQRLAVRAFLAPSLTVPRITDSPSAWVVPETGSGSVAALPSGLRHNPQPAAWTGAQQLQVIPPILETLKELSITTDNTAEMMRTHTAEMNAALQQTMQQTVTELQRLHTAQTTELQTMRTQIMTELAELRVEVRSLQQAQRGSNWSGWQS